MTFLAPGQAVPEGTIFVTMATAQEAKFLEEIEERKRWCWLRRLRRRAGRWMESLTVAEYERNQGATHEPK